MLRFRIVAAARPVGAAVDVPDVDRAEQAVDVADDRRRVDDARQPLVALELLLRLRAQFRREVDQVVLRSRCSGRTSGAAGGCGCVGEYHSPGTSPCRHRLLFDRPDRLAGDAVEDVEPRLLARHRDDLARPAVDGHVGDAAAPTTCRRSRSDGARTGSATCACRSPDRRRRGSRRTGCCRAACRRRSQTSAFRPAGRRGRAPRPR